MRVDFCVDGVLIARGTDKSLKSKGQGIHPTLSPTAGLIGGILPLHQRLIGDGDGQCGYVIAIDKKRCSKQRIRRCSAYVHGIGSRRLGITRTIGGIEGINHQFLSHSIDGIDSITIVCS